MGGLTGDGNGIHPQIRCLTLRPPEFPQSFQVNSGRITGNAFASSDSVYRITCTGKP